MTVMVDDAWLAVQCWAEHGRPRNYRIAAKHMPDCSDPLEDRYRVRMALMERFGFAADRVPDACHDLTWLVSAESACAGFHKALPRKRPHAADRSTSSRHGPGCQAWDAVDLPVRGCQRGAGSWYRLAMRPTKSAASASASRPR
jgi:hypothetical protein